MNSGAVDVKLYQRNNLAWLNHIQQYGCDLPQISGIIITGWSRYNHFTPLCELLPAAIPSLAMNLLTVKHGITLANDRVRREAREMLKCGTVFSDDWTNCRFPGLRLFTYIEKLQDLKSQSYRRYEWATLGRLLHQELSLIFFEETVLEWLYYNIQMPMNAAEGKPNKAKIIADVKGQRYVPLKSDLDFYSGSGDKQ